LEEYDECLLKILIRRRSKINANLKRYWGKLRVLMSDAEKHYGEDRILRPIMPELDTVRGIAILMVFLFHSFEDFTPSGLSVPG
jgi:hypothetical protein